MYGPADDARQDRELAALAQHVKDINWRLDGIDGALRNLHVRIDRMPVPTLPPVTGFWSFLLRLFGK